MKLKMRFSTLMLCMSLFVGVDMKLITRVKSASDIIDEEIENSQINFSEIDILPESGDISELQVQTNEIFSPLNLNSDGVLSIA